MSSGRAVTWLPRIPHAVTIGHIPQRLKSPKLEFHRARLQQFFRSSDIRVFLSLSALTMDTHVILLGKTTPELSVMREQTKRRDPDQFIRKGNPVRGWMAVDVCNITTIIPSDVVRHVSELIVVDEGNEHILRRMCSTLFREERAEFRFHRAVELRPYAERLLQLGILRGAEDPYTSEMVDWWIMDGDIREKFYEVYVPRFKGQEGPYTSLFYIEDDPGKGFYDRGVIELNGNPYPPVIVHEMDHSQNLLNVLLKNAVRQQISNLQALYPENQETG